ncbi:MAG: AMP-binding protein [Prevotella sp.]|nr:AMP-binding protein [Prevotella sp.]
MGNIPSFNAYIERSIIDNWHLDALTDYKGITLQYKDVARKIAKLHIMFEQVGIRKGDKIAICGRNSAHWAVIFLSTITYGAVIVPILHEFNAEQIHNIVNHSDARFLFVGDHVMKIVDADEMPKLEGMVALPDFSILVSRSEQLNYARAHLNELFGKKYPEAFRADNVHYHHDEPDELALINYTSGTTGFSKGVMIPYRAIWSNVDYCMEVLGPHIKHGSNTLSVLPMAHMYGLAIEFLFDFCQGCHNYFLNRIPSPSLIAEAMAQVKPAIVICVPLILEKIIRKRVFPVIQTNRMRILLNMPIVSRKVKQKICEQVLAALGGKAYQVIVGGAALNQEIEQFLKSIDFPVTVGYGATECAPLISFSNYDQFVPGSCGTAAARMEVKILSSDPEHIPGEIVTRGTNVMLGYYKNEEATREALDADGWYHTGDLGTMNADGHVFIRGRIKSMILGASGQNIYPEEIEDKLNSLPMVSESVVVSHDNKLVGLVYPDFDEASAMGFTRDDLEKIMEQNRKDLNNLIPTYCHVSSIIIHDKEFAKTPKRSIKRYLYQSI